MIDKFLMWVGKNRKPISLTIILSTSLLVINYLLQGQFMIAFLWLLVVFFLIYDAWDY